MSLPHFSEESGSSYCLRKQHHKRVEAGYLFTLTHNRVLLAFASWRSCSCGYLARIQHRAWATREGLATRAGQRS
jgi:hypothetical protein